MDPRPLLASLLLALAGCEAVNEGDPGAPEFTLASSCLVPVPEPVQADPAGRADLADAPGLRVLLVSAERLHFIVPVDLNCGLEYAFSASLPSPDTLVIEQRETGGAVARCMCKKELTVSLRAEPGQRLDGVKVLKTPSGTFADFH